MGQTCLKSYLVRIAFPWTPPPWLLGGRIADSYCNKIEVEEWNKGWSWIQLEELKTSSNSVIKAQFIERACARSSATFMFLVRWHDMSISWRRIMSALCCLSCAIISLILYPLSIFQVITVNPCRWSCAICAWTSFLRSIRRTSNGFGNPS